MYGIISLRINPRKKRKYMIPFYLKNHLINIKEKKDITKAILVSTAGNSNLEIYYYGQLLEIQKSLLVVDGEHPCLILAKDPSTNEEFIVFDGAKHGYDAMFCNEVEKDIKRDLVRYEKYSGEIEITLGYSIDYEEEKDNNYKGQYCMSTMKSVHLRYDTYERDNSYERGSIGELNGFNKIEAPLPESIDEIVELIKSRKGE